MSKTYIKVNGKKYELLNRRYDPIFGCFFYYVKERDEPFNDLIDDIEIVGKNWRLQK